MATLLAAPLVVLFYTTMITTSTPAVLLGKAAALPTSAAANPSNNDSDDLQLQVGFGLEHALNATRPPPRPPPPPAVPMPLHPFWQFAPAGDVDGTFFYNGTYHIFRCCDFQHLSAPTPAGPWTDLGTQGSPARDGGYISGSATVVNGIPRMVMPLFRGNPKKSHCCADSKTHKPHSPPWRYPCIANPPQGACHMDYVMSMPTNLSDPHLRMWQGVASQITIVNGSQGAPGHGYIQQDPSHAWYDDQSKRWLFIGGSYINGSAGHASGSPILELFGSIAGDDWSKGFEFLSIFSQSGLAACDPELIQFKNQRNVSVLYSCMNQYLIGHVVPSCNGFRFEALNTMPSGVMKIEYGNGAGKGFYHAELDRYLLWMMSDGGYGYSTAREVTVDESLPLLLTYPAREYTAMRQTPQVILKGASQQDATALMAKCDGAAQMDIDLTYHFGKGSASAGDCICLSILGGAAAVAIIFDSPTVAVLNDGPCLQHHGKPNKQGGFLFGLKPNETSVSLRVLIDGNSIESFAQFGRAQVSFPGTLRNKSWAVEDDSISTSGWNTSIGLLGTTSSPGIVDVGVWPLAFPAEWTKR